MSPALKKSSTSPASRKKEGQAPYNWPMLSQEKLFLSGDKELIWKKYCGFLDMSIDEFMVMQRLLLLEQIDIAMSSMIGLNLIGDRKPSSVSDFRKFVPLTTYGDYKEFLEKKDNNALGVKTYLWVHSSGRTGSPKWVPYSLSTLNSLANDVISALILSSASKKGEVLLNAGDRIALDLPAPNIAEITRKALYQRLVYRQIPAKEIGDALEFEERNKRILLSSLDQGIDYLVTLPVMMAKMNDDLNSLGKNLNDFLHCHPMAVLRTLKAVFKSRLGRHTVSPRDVWKVKGLICGGTDSSYHRTKISSGWGVDPLDVYIATETSFMAMQGWNKKGLTFLPHSQFFEFIPEEELKKCEDDKDYQPSTVLINELKENRVYEVVISNFHGGPFLRYRIGDLIKVISLRDDETNVNLPQVVFFNRADFVYDTQE